ncbi:MAG: tRNA(His) guanylyltransferase Thg1 family protein [Lachnospiraceae bacterium]
MGNKKMQRDDLGNRMKGNYETIPKIRLMRRTPVIIRIDGKAFHTLTKGFRRPFDPVLMKTMQQTMLYLCENIQGCVLGYCQSDEISLVLIDYQRFTSSGWFDYEIQKMVSVSASMATMEFNRRFRENAEAAKEEAANKEDSVFKAYEHAMQIGAMFDSRVFNIPKEEVTNYVYWRQIDASRNSVQMVGQANFSQKELHCKSSSDIQDMLMLQKGINWNDYLTVEKRGCCAVKNKSDESERNWVIDTEIPIFKGEDRAYIEELIYVGEV